jgi:hypothetical protein
MIEVQGKRFNAVWLKSVSLKFAQSVCTDTSKEIVSQAWNIANETIEKPKPKRNRAK